MHGHLVGVDVVVGRADKVDVVREGRQDLGGKAAVVEAGLKGVNLNPNFFGPAAFADGGGLQVVDLVGGSVFLVSDVVDEGVGRAELVEDIQGVSVVVRVDQAVDVVVGRVVQVVDLVEGRAVHAGEGVGEGTHIGGM